MRKKEITVFGVFLILFTILLVWLFLKNIIGVPEAIDLILLFALVCVTAIYAIRTAEIAKATKEQADASIKMAKEMREQRYDALRPIVDIVNMEQTSLELFKRAYEKKPPNELKCTLCNVGVGPATDVYSFVHPPSEERRRRNLDTIAVGKEKGPERLSLAQKGERWFLVAYYKDVYGRWFESSREVRVGAVNPDPLQIREITEEELPK